MHISHKAIDRPRVAIVGVLMVIAMAVMAALYIPVQRTPAIDKAVILVIVPYPGAEPIGVENKITRKIEDALEGLNNVDFIASTSMRGSSVTQVMFLDGVTGKQARADVEHLVNEVRALLPRGREIQPRIVEIDFESTPIMLVNLRGPAGFDQRTLKRIADDVQKELEAISGVSNTQQFGGREREIHVNVNHDLFVEYGLTVGQIRMALANFHSEMPGGSLNTSKFDYQIRNETKLRNIDDVRQTIVAQRDGRLIRIEDVAEVRDTYRRIKSVAKLDGEDTATIVVNKEADINTLGTARAIKQRVAELQKEYPHIRFSTTRDVSEDISIMFWVLGSSAVSGGMLVLVILMWSMGFRISMLVLMAIPFSTAIGLIFLYAAGISISNMVLFSFILVLGMVVDGAIIVAENIHRHIERGEPPIEAAKTGIDEVGIPVIAADLTTVAAFLPMLLVPGIMGDFMSVMPKVVSVALVGSIVVDHFLIPVLAAYWYRRHEPRTAEGDATASQGNNEHVDHPESRIRPNHGPLTGVYARVLRYSLNHRWVAIGCAICAIVWAGFTCKQIGFIFFPESDRGQFSINYELPLGYSVEESVRVADMLAEPLLKLQESGELIHFVTAVGSSEGLSTRLETDPVAGPEFGKIMVQLQSPMRRKRHQNEILAELRQWIDAHPWPGMKYNIEVVKEGPPGGSPVAVRLTGKDLEQLGQLADQIAGQLEIVPGTVEVSTDYRPSSPELVVEPHPGLAGLTEIHDAEVAMAVQTAMLGDSAIQIVLDDEDVTLRLQAAPEFQKNKRNVERLMLTGKTGRRATVGQLADVRRDVGLYAVNRWQRSRAVTVRCDVLKDQINPETGNKYTPEDVFKKLRKKIMPEIGFDPTTSDDGVFKKFRKNVMPILGFAPVEDDCVAFHGRPSGATEGVAAKFTGENEEIQKNFAYMLNSMVIGVILIFGILVIQFNSFRQTLVVLATVPLSFVGVIFGMWVCGHAFSLATFIGLICLVGIVVNDAIVLVDFTNQARRRGMGVKEALMEAGVNRLRPVLLTTVTTIGGLFPLFMNFSGGAEFWQPLTGAVIFGLAFATVLTLVMIPVCYSLAYGFPSNGRS